MGGERVHTLGPADTLLHLAVHTVHHHGFRGVLWAVDFLACMRTWRLRPSDVSGASPPIQRSLWYCLELLAANGVDPAPAMRLSVRPQRVFPLERQMIERLGRREVPEVIRYAFTLRCLPTWKEKVAFARQLFLPDPSVFSKGFIDAGGIVQTRGQHLRSAMRDAWTGLRAALLGRPH